MTPKHGEMTHYGDEFNKDPMYFCEKCAMSHAIGFLDCDGLLGPKKAVATEYTGGSVSYYRVQITAPVSGGDAYTAECNDIIEALGMSYAEGNAFKALWRRCAARNLGIAKRGYTDGLYDAEKVVFFGERLVAQERQRKKSEG
jgi:hypothetical protein